MDEKHKQKSPNPIKTSQQAIRNNPLWYGIALVFFCFVAAALGATVVLVAQDDLQQAITSETREIVSREGELVSEIAEELGQSTVAISTESVNRNVFFGSSLQRGAGTGIIVSEDGYIMTNRHVIPENVETVNVTLSDDTEYEDVRVVGRDPANDVAFLKIQGAEGLQPASLGNSSEMEVGEKVIAIGNALGQFQNTVTTGVLSGVGRPIAAQEGAGEVQQLNNLLQTDAAINPGNSGGPLVNLNGEVIGMNTAVAQGAEGIGFAIPIDEVKGLIESVTEQDELVRPFVGVRTVTLTSSVAEQLNVETENGAYVVEGGVVQGSPADEAGLRGGDIITQVEGQELNEDTVLGSVVTKYDVGEEISLTILRGGETRELQLTLEEFPAEF